MRAHATFGLLVGDSGDFHTFNLGVDANCLWDVSNSFDVGIATGFNSSSGDEYNSFTVDSNFNLISTKVSIDNLSYIPLAAVGRFNASEDFVLALI